MRFTMGYFVEWTVLLVSICLAVDASAERPQEKQPTRTNQTDRFRLLETPDGIRFGMCPAERDFPAPVAFLFGSLLRESLTEEPCRILQASW